MTPIRSNAPFWDFAQGRLHECNPFCRGDRHVCVIYSVIPDDDFVAAEAQAVAPGVEVLGALPAPEAPPFALERAPAASDPGCYRLFLRGPSWPYLLIWRDRPCPRTPR